MGSEMCIRDRVVVVVVVVVVAATDVKFKSECWRESRSRRLSWPATYGRLCFVYLKRKLASLCLRFCTS